MNSFFVVLLLLFAVMWFMLIRPQRQQQKRHADMLQTLKVGDEVLTTGGIYGEITGVDNERVMLEVDDDVQVAVAKRAIASVVPPEELQRLEGEHEEPELPRETPAPEEDPARR